MKNLNSIILRFFSVIIISLTSFCTHAQNEANNMDVASSLGTTTNWCSAAEQFSTSELEFNQPFGSCYDKSFMYGKWFKFLATSNNIEIKVKVSNGAGTMKFPYIYLYDGQLNTISCQAPLDDTTNIVVKSNKLTVGSWYYIGVYNHNHSKYIGTFTLCVNNQISNDFKEGATELFELENWCSEPMEYSTALATPDGNKPSCLSNGPNFNRWFTFIAESSQGKFEIKYGDKFGSCQFPYLTLWDENFKELACDKYTNEHQEISIDYNSLVPNKRYYLSVDHQFNEDYLGTFTLCADAAMPSENDVVVKTVDLANTDLLQITGRVMFNKTLQPKANLSVQLLDKNKNVVNTTTTDKNGQFKFQKIKKSDAFMVVIEDKGEDLIMEVFQTNNEGEIIRQSILLDKNQVGFDNLNPSCNKLILLDCNNSFDLDIQTGKSGVIGKIVNKKDPATMMPDVGVYLYDHKKEIIDSTKTDNIGGFKFVNLIPKNNYMLKLGIDLKHVYAEMLMINDQGTPHMSSSSKDVGPDGFFSFKELPFIEANALKPMNFQDVAMEDFENIAKSGNIVLKNIHFNEGDFKLLDKSYSELNNLIKYLNNHPNAQIIISGHTDNTGNYDKNIELSKKRAEEVVAYLINNGISSKRLTAVGYGSSKPIADNGTVEGRKKNRRVEFKIN